MRTGIALGTLLAIACAGTSTALAAASGGRMFTQHCAACHPDGGNVINPKKTLHRKDLAANGIKGPGDIVRVMRNPGPGMTAFAATDVPDRDAEAIAGYILKTFR